VPGEGMDTRTARPTENAGIHGAETVVEGRGTTEFENGLVPPRRRAIL